MYTLRINNLLYHPEFKTIPGILVMNRFWNNFRHCVLGFHPEYLNFYAPLEKGGIFFATVGRYVRRSVCRSVDQVLSGQYLLTPSLDQYQTWCRGCPQYIDDPYWFSGHMFKGQGQTTLLSPLCCPLNIFWPLYLFNTKLGAGVDLNE